MRRFIVLFVIAILVAYGTIYLPWVRDNLVGPFTVGITYFSGYLIQLFGGQVSMSGNLLSIPGFTVQVLDMCNGVEATLILWCAVIAFPAPFVYKLKGLLVGTLTVHVLNIGRIISLVYLGAYDDQWFHWFHVYIWDAVIMLDILAIFLVWLRWMPRLDRDAHDTPATA